MADKGKNKAPAPMPTQQERPDLYDAPDLGPRGGDLPPYKTNTEVDKFLESLKKGNAKPSEAPKDDKNDQAGATDDPDNDDGK